MPAQVRKAMERVANSSREVSAELGSRARVASLTASFVVQVPGVSCVTTVCLSDMASQQQQKRGSGDICATGLGFANRQWKILSFMPNRCVSLGAHSHRLFTLRSCHTASCCAALPPMSP